MFHNLFAAPINWKWLTRVMLLAGLAAMLPSVTRSQGTAGDWISYGHDPQGTRFSPLSQIDRSTVSRLQPAWTYHTGESGIKVGSERLSLETTPIVIDGAMYFITPVGRVIALDAATGRERWIFDARVDRNLSFGDHTSRGVSVWVDSAASRGSACRTRIIAVTVDARLFSLDARRGTRCPGFGERGMIDLRRGLRNAPFETEEYEETSPPAIINGLIVVGSAVADNNRIDAASGEVRAYDARTGALRWTFDPVVQDSTDPAWKTWIGPHAHQTGAANAWSVIAADPARDLVFVPTGSPSPDYFGGERLGSNSYANSVVALHASTGRVAWSFQSVHHDLWDFDNASPPAVVTIHHDGAAVPAVLQANKTGHLFVLNRETGVPIFPVEERPVPASDVPGETASATQPFPSVVPPLSRHSLPADSAWGITPDQREWCTSKIASLRNEGIFTPPSERGTLVVPSNIGGAHWGGVAVDVTREIAVIPVNTVVAEVQLIPVASYDRSTREEGFEYTHMRGTPYVMRRRILRSPSGLPCSPPPFGELVAIDLKTGRMLWHVPLGSIASLASEKGAALLPKGDGSPNLGGAIVTAGGLVFMAGTLDHTFRAFDVETGGELWSASLPAGAKATPMTYAVRGRQFVVIAAGGDRNVWGNADAITAFALPGANTPGRR